MRLCARGAVFGAYLVINARHANAPFISVIPLITANAGPLAMPSSVRVALFLVIPMSGFVASSAPASNAGMCADRRDT